MSKQDYALKLFANGLNCAQAVAMAYSGFAGIQEAQAMRLMCGFGSGIGGSQQTCGAVCGGALVISGIFGNSPEHDSTESLERKQNTRDICSTYLKNFKAAHGSLNCADIIGKELNNPDDWSAAREQGLFLARCVPAVAKSAELVETLISSSMHSFLSIGLAHGNELEAIIDVQKKAFHQVGISYGDPDLPPLRQSVDELRSEWPELLLLTAKWQGRIIGSVRMRREADTGHVGRLVVLPEFQGMGIGRILMQDLEKRAENIKRFEIFTGSRSDKTIALYKSLGYRVFDEGEEKPGLDLVYMEKAVR